ncbi:MAG TPA: DUF1761 domain-containing protein, partial [Chitinophagales bacterium]|nr:DUF1761 domain-containing protein [Chitinophagales bacterium]
GMNMALVFIVTYIMGLLLSVALSSTVIHQMHLFSLATPEPNTQPNPVVTKWLHDSLTLHATSYRRYRHGALHGAIFGVFALLPVISVNALFERKGFKYIAINAGFWIVCSVIMGAIICHWFVLTMPQ